MDTAPFAAGWGFRIVNWEKFSSQIAREASEYLADLRALRNELRSAEGWVALGLLVSAVIITIAWAVVSLGFSPPNEHVIRLVYQLGMRTCQPISNVNGVVIIINLFLLLFLTVISMGNVLNLIDRVKHGHPREPRDLIISASMMLVVGIGGIAYMLWIC